MPTPPFTVSAKVLRLHAEVERLLGRGEGLEAPRPQPRLRKESRVRTVGGSVAIEGNTLTLEQVTALLDGKRVMGPRADIVAVLNANAAYDRASHWNPWSEKALLSAHRTLMHGLVPDAGRYRQGSVGVFRGRQVTHVAPPARRVPALVYELLEWGRLTQTPRILAACVIHCELLFIRPFSDGTGRLARLWQHVVLLAESPLFAFVPAESLIRSRQADSYAALRTSDRAGDCTRFVELALETLRDALAGVVGALRPPRPTVESRLEAAAGTFGARWFSRRDYLALHRALSTATASRDLSRGLEQGVLRKRGARRLTSYQFRR